MGRLARDRRFLSGVFLLFTLAGVAMLVTGDASDRVVGLVVLLMFGGGGSAWVVGEYVSKPAAPVHEGDVRLPSGASSRGLIFPIRTGKILAAIVAVAFFGLASAVAAVYPEALGWRGEAFRWLFAAVAIVAAIVVVTTLPKVRGPGPIIALLPSGILHRTYGTLTYVPWWAVRALVPLEFHAQPFLAIDVRAPEAVERQGGPRLLGSLERSVTGRDVTIPLAGLSVSPETVMDLAISHLERRPADRASLDASGPPGELDAVGPDG
ncbi:MAG: hypothetical protein M3432_06930 [Chloroflexota bacterium]|nr:hypothetical protein [Chloroflexota bacterium]